jgi:hypothetical protein
MSYSDGGTGARPYGDSRVVITGVQIPFGELIVLILKIALASIPVYLVMAVLFMMFAGIFGGIFAGILGAIL